MIPAAPSAQTKKRNTVLMASTMEETNPTMEMISGSASVGTAAAAAPGTPNIVDYELNRRIAEAHARFNKLRENKELVTQKSGLRKAFEEMIVQSPPPPPPNSPEDNTVRKMKKEKASPSSKPYPQQSPQSSLRNFLNFGGPASA